MCVVRSCDLFVPRSNGGPRIIANKYVHNRARRAITRTGCCLSGAEDVNAWTRLSCLMHFAIDRRGTTKQAKKGEDEKC